MAVASILAQKGREVVTALPDRTLQDVATILAERKIGAIVITDGQGKVLGMRRRANGNAPREHCHRVAATPRRRRGRLR